MILSIDSLTSKILEHLNISSNIILKSKIRGMPGITSYQLVKALISTNTVKEASELLGYTDNPVKQCIRSLLNPHFNYSHPGFGKGAGKNWRRKLLLLIGYKHCNKCNLIKSVDKFQLDSEIEYSSHCKSCRLIKTKLEKKYIVERTPRWSEIEEINIFYKNCPEGYHVDHIIPLRGEQVSGLHVLNNLQYLLARENIIKKNNYSVC